MTDIVFALFEFAFRLSWCLLALMIDEVESYLVFVLTYKALYRYKCSCEELKWLVELVGA